MRTQARTQTPWTTRLALVAVAAAGLAIVDGGCSSPDSTERFHGKFPDETTWKPVADMLIHRCGSLDCHGQPGRNLKLYGYIGLRLAPGDSPQPATPLGWATTAEYDADYASVCGLEPENLTAVFEDGGKDPERLTLVQKPRNTQVHKGGKIIAIGDVQDKCLLSWLAGSVDTASCTAALTLP